MTFIGQKVVHAVLATALMAAAAVGTGGADEAGERQPADFRGEHFLLHTDLRADEAQDLLDRLEVMLRIMADYWDQPSRGIIECYVVEDLSRWPEGSIDSRAVPSLKSGGLTIAEGVRRGRQLDLRAVVYASSQFGTPQHEAVHAYCYQTFGSTGPTWYAEGMAELGNYWVEHATTVNCPEYVVDFLKSSPRPTLEELTDTDQESGDGWRAYAWRWALCHFLSMNGNYSDRFRTLGAALLRGRRGSFRQAFRTQQEELQFEFTFFLDHLEPGFDASRSRWDWTKNPKALTAARPAKCDIRAARGWQPTGVLLTAGTPCRIECTGTWTTSPEIDPHAVTSDSEGPGHLEGCVFLNYQLSEPFPVIPGQPMLVPQDGHLMLRCADLWTSLNDNDGQIQVRISIEPGPAASEPRSE